LTTAPSVYTAGSIAITPYITRDIFSDQFGAYSDARSKRTPLTWTFPTAMCSAFHALQAHFLGTAAQDGVE